MSIRPFNTFLTQSDEVTQLQNNVERTLDDLSTYFPGISIICDGKLTAYSTIGVGAGVDFIIYHNLGRIPKGFLIAKTQSPFNVYESSTVNTDPTKQIIFNKDAAFPIIASFWIF